MLADEQLFHAWTNGAMGDKTFLSQLLRIAMDNNPDLVPKSHDLILLRQETAKRYGVSHWDAVMILKAARENAGAYDDDVDDHMSSEEWGRYQDDLRGDFE